MRTSLSIAIALFLLAGPAQAGKFQLFTYRSAGGSPRVCKGDTATGIAVCADGTANTAEAKGADLPAKWEAKQTAQVNYLRFRLGEASGQAGRYQFFRYYSDKGQVRICAGDTAAGVAICADGTPESASAQGPTPPTDWQVKAQAKTLLLKYFWPAQAEPGRYGFASYANSRGQARICRMDTANGAAICAAGTAVSAHITGQSAPNWLANPESKTRYFSY